MGDSVHSVSFLCNLFSSTAEDRCNREAVAQEVPVLFATRLGGGHASGFLIADDVLGGNRGRIDMHPGFLVACRRDTVLLRLLW